MAASVRIEDEAFSDLRFEILATECGLADADHARGKMARLWRQCTVEHRHFLTPHEITQVLGENGVRGLVRSRLGTNTKKGIRIHGTKGRIEWLQTLRTNGKRFGHLGAEHGKKGGRPKKPESETPKEGSKNPLERVTENPPPAPAPATAPAPAPAPAPITPPNTEEARADSVPPTDSIDGHESAYHDIPFPIRFRALVKRYPHKAPAVRAKTAWKLAVKTEDDAIKIELGADAWIACEQWQSGKGIPSLANFIGEAWYENHPEPAKDKDHAKRSSRTSARYDPERDG